MEHIGEPEFISYVCHVSKVKCENAISFRGVLLDGNPTASSDDTSSLSDYASSDYASSVTSSSPSVSSAELSIQVPKPSASVHTVVSPRFVAPPRVPTPPLPDFVEGEVEIAEEDGDEDGDEVLSNYFKSLSVREVKALILFAKRQAVTAFEKSQAKAQAKVTSTV